MQNSLPLVLVVSYGSEQVETALGSSGISARIGKVALMGETLVHTGSRLLQGSAEDRRKVGPGPHLDPVFSAWNRGFLALYLSVFYTDSPSLASLRICMEVSRTRDTRGRQGFRTC